jgi:hypothetical protein
MLPSNFRLSYSSVIEFLTCQRKWYYNHLIGLKPVEGKSAALVLGSLWHELLESGGNKWPEDETIKDKFEKVYPMWKEKFDALELKILSSEMWLEKSFCGLTFVGKADGLVEDSAGRVHLLEHKSTSAALNFTMQSLEDSDQPTTYKWLYDKPVEGIVVTAASFGAIPSVEMGFLYRNSDDIKALEKGLESVVSQMLPLLKDSLLFKKEEKYQEFPRNGSACGMYGGCPYRELCRLGPKRMVDSGNFYLTSEMEEE